MANEPSHSDSENQSLRKINAEISALNADVADGIIVNGLSAIDAKLPALSSGRIPVDISSATLSVTADGVEIKNDSGNPIPISDNNASLTVDGAVTASQGGTWNITNVSGTVSLPTGAATAANQSTTNTSLSSIDTKVATAANQTTTNTNLSTISGKLPSALVSDRLKVDGSGVTQPVSGTFWQATQPVSGTFFQATQPVSAASLPLPSGAATETTLSSVNTKLPSNLTVTSTRLLVDGSGVTQPISGTVTANAGTGSFTVAQGTAASLNATVVGSGSFTAAQATAANLNATVVGSGSFTAAQATASNLKAQAQILDSGGNQLSYAATGTAGTPASDVVSVQGITNGTAIAVTDNSGSLTVDGTVTANAGTGTFAISAASLPRPSGASTEAKQDTIIGHIDGLEGHVDGLEGLLTTIDTDTGSIDTKLPSGLTVTSNRLSVDGSGVTQPVSGTVTAVPDKGAVTVTAGSTDATPSTSAQALGTDANRKFLFIQNASDTDMYFNFGAAATTAHLLLKTGQHGILFGPAFVPTDAVNVICGSASKAYYILSA